MRADQAVGGLQTTLTYYVYNLLDADGVVRYVGKGTGRRLNTHLGIIQALAAGLPAARASKMHRRFAAELQFNRLSRAIVVADGLSQADAYAMEASLSPSIGARLKEALCGTCLQAVKDFRGSFAMIGYWLPAEPRRQKGSAGLDCLQE